MIDNVESFFPLGIIRRSFIRQQSVCAAVRALQELANGHQVFLRHIQRRHIAEDHRLADCARKSLLEFIQQRT